MLYITNCPFCKDTLGYIDEDIDCSSKNLIYTYYVNCPSCEAKGPTAKTMELARELWNESEGI